MKEPIGYRMCDCIDSVFYWRTVMGTGDFGQFPWQPFGVLEVCMSRVAKDTHCATNVCRHKDHVEHVWIASIINRDASNSGKQYFPN